MRLDPLHFWLVALAICFGIIFLVLLLPIGHAHAMTLEIYGHSAGQGVQLMNFSGEQLNVSLWQNASGWNVSAVGCS